MKRSIHQNVVHRHPVSGRIKCRDIPKRSQGAQRGIVDELNLWRHSLSVDIRNRGVIVCHRRHRVHRHIALIRRIRGGGLGPRLLVDSHRRLLRDSIQRPGVRSVGHLSAVCDVGIDAAVIVAAAR